MMKIRFSQIIDIFEKKAAENRGPESREETPKKCVAASLLHCTMY
jgi:hypothetical protein